MTGKEKFHAERWRKASSEHFREVSPDYDAGRSFESAAFWARQITHHVSLSERDWLLDLGSGTGLFSTPFARLLPCSVVGLDLSPVMLSYARGKADGTGVHWLRGKGEALPFSDRTLRAAFLSQVWHHLREGGKVARELCRVLEPGGALFVKTFSHAQLRRRWDLTVVFPELLPFMLEIYPDTPDFGRLLGNAGFGRVTHRSFRKPDTLRPSTLLRIAEERLWSMFSYVSEEGLRAGTDYLRELIAETGDVPVPGDEMHLLIVARR